VPFITLVTRVKVELGLDDSMRPREAIIQACDVLGIDAAAEISQGHGLKALAMRLATELGIIVSHHAPHSSKSGIKLDGTGSIEAGPTATQVEEETSSGTEARQQTGGIRPRRTVSNGTWTVTFPDFTVEDDSLRLGGLELAANPAWMQPRAASGSFSTCVARWSESDRLICSESSGVQTGDLVVAVAGVSAAGVDHGSLLRLIATAERPLNLTFCPTDFMDQIAEDKRLSARTPDTPTQHHHTRVASPSRSEARSPRRARSVSTATRRHETLEGTVHERLSDWRSFTVSVMMAHCSLQYYRYLCDVASND
jgi:hypothetical protein